MAATESASQQANSPPTANHEGPSPTENSSDAPVSDDSVTTASKVDNNSTNDDDNGDDGDNQKKADKTSDANDEKSASAGQNLAQPSNEPEAGRTKLQTTVIMGALAMSLFLAALDTTIITTAVPTIVDHFDAPVGYIWIGSAYLLGNAAVVPVWGKVSDIFGRKQTLLVSVAVFLLGSLLCALSNSIGMLIAARAIQGVGGGGAILLPNICISDLFSLKKRGMYFGMLGMVWALASALGPVIGGVFTSRVSWRW